MDATEFFEWFDSLDFESDGLEALAPDYIWKGLLPDLCPDGVKREKFSSGFFGDELEHARYLAAFGEKAANSHDLIRIIADAFRDECRMAYNAKIKNVPSKALDAPPVRYAEALAEMIRVGNHRSLNRLAEMVAVIGQMKSKGTEKPLVNALLSDDPNKWKEAEGMLLQSKEGSTKNGHVWRSFCRLVSENRHLPRAEELREEVKRASGEEWSPAFREAQKRVGLAYLPN